MGSMMGPADLLSGAEGAEDRAGEHDRLVRGVEAVEGRFRGSEEVVARVAVR